MPSFMSLIQFSLSSRSALSTNSALMLTIGGSGRAWKWQLFRCILKCSTKSSESPPQISHRPSEVRWTQTRCSVKVSSTASSLPHASHFWQVRVGCHCGSWPFRPHRSELSLIHPHLPSQLLGHAAAAFPPLVHNIILGHLHYICKIEATYQELGGNTRWNIWKG